MKKLLILGCSHSIGSFGLNINEGIFNHDVNNGWVNLIAKKYSNYNVDCFSHPGGGSLNYLVTIGLLEDKIFDYDKIIVQHTDDLRLTLYNVGSIFKFPEDLYISTKINNLNRYYYKHIKRDTQFNHLYLHQTDMFAEFFKRNVYLPVSIQSYKTIIKNMFGNKLYDFEWNDLKIKINDVYGNDTYEKIVNSIDNKHLDIFGNKLVFELLEKDLDNFL